MHEKATVARVLGVLNSEMAISDLYSWKVNCGAE